MEEDQEQRALHEQSSFKTRQHLLTFTCSKHWNSGIEHAIVFIFTTSRKLCHYPPSLSFTPTFQILLPGVVP